MKKKNPKDYARALYEATRELKGKELGASLDRFVTLLSQAGLIKKSERIIHEFIQYAKTQEGIVDIEITSAHALGATTLNHIKKVFGDKVEAIEKVKPELLGGVIVKTKDTILDGSVRTQLHNLKMKLSV